MKKSITLLEIVIGITLLLIAGGLGTHTLSKVLQKRKFYSDIEKLSVQIISCQRLAMNMQADWTLFLEKKEKGWMLKARSMDQPESFPIPPLKLSFSSLLLNGNARESLQIDLFSSGEVSPKGEIMFLFKKEKKQIDLLELLQRKESSP